jgi:hypothetical protein
MLCARNYTCILNSLDGLRNTNSSQVFKHSQ